jgi:hypothetical protein
VEAAPQDSGWRVLRARAEVIALRWAAHEHKLAPDSFQAARAPLLPLLDRERVDPDLYQTMAEIAEIDGAWLLSSKKSADEAIARGLAMAEKALAINPRMARALATKGALLLLRARSAREPEPRADALRGAGEALAAAVRENPLLERQLRPLLQASALVAPTKP